VVTAVARALYRDEPGPVILDDDLALGLAGEDGLALAKRLRTELPRAHVLAFCRWMCIRARFAEDLVERAISRGVGQYVILGAGLDSFAYRRGDLTDRIRVFEVDHPASQSWKQRRLREMGIEIPDNLVFAPVDFERQTLREGLVSAGFSFARTAVFFSRTYCPFCRSNHEWFAKQAWVRERTPAGTKEALVGQRVDAP